jgi:AraC-like DNA-binding protein
MDGTLPKENVNLWLPGIEGLELMRATYDTQRFARHARDGFAVSVIEDGALGFHYRGASVVAPAGTINLANPDEVHTGQAADTRGWTYRMYYMPHELLQRAAEEIAAGAAGFPFFQKGVVRDPLLASCIRGLHIDFATRQLDRLEAESRFLEMLVLLIRRHADAPPRAVAVGRDNREVDRAREYMHAYFADDLSIEKVAAVAGLSPYYFTRVFGQASGLPPHAYLTQIRIRRARAMLIKGMSVAETACAGGFADQSHLTRQIKRLTGITPGKYRRIVQENF